jgi:hypothetical protein
LSGYFFRYKHYMNNKNILNARILTIIGNESVGVHQ